MGTPLPSAEGNFEELTRENTRLKEELQLANDRVEAVQRELQSFVYAAGHDLKQALRSIGSYTQLLGRGGVDAESTAVYTAFILDGVKSANTLIEHIVTLSRAGSSPSRTTLNLASCVHTALYKLAGEIKDRGATVTVHDLPQVTVNQVDFELVFEKLIDNALKYSDPQRPPQVEISAEEGDDGHIVSIGDNGQGVPEKHHEEIFQPFKRLHGKQVPGAGMGLALGRKIVEAHHGHLWVESEGATGSVFKLKLPY